MLVEQSLKKPQMLIIIFTPKLNTISSVNYALKILDFYLNLMTF